MVDLVPPAGTPPAESPAGGQPPATPPKEPEKKMMSQAEIDAIIEDRLVRDRKTRETNKEAELAKELGMTLKEAKALIKAKKEIDDAAKTELQRLQEEKAGLLQSIKDRDLKELRRQKVEVLITEKKIKLPDGITVSDILEMVGGQDENGINEGLVKFQKLFPFTASGMPGSNPANPPGKDPNLDEQIRAAQAEALKTGNWDLYTRLCMQKQSQKSK